VNVINFSRKKPNRLHRELYKNEASGESRMDKTTRVTNIVVAGVIESISFTQKGRNERGNKQEKKERHIKHFGRAKGCLARRAEICRNSRICSGKHRLAAKQINCTDV
jgi:hypothetical protein